MKSEQMEKSTHDSMEQWLANTVPERYRDETRERLEQFYKDNSDDLDYLGNLSWSNIDIRTKVKS